MSKVIISAIATVAAIAATAGSITFGDSSNAGAARPTGASDGYYITELRKSDRLAIKP
jgi:hypothetical protein